MASCGPEHGCVAILQQADGSTVYSPHFRSWLRHILRTNHVQTLCRQSSNESRAFCANTMTAVELLRPSSNPGGQHRRVWDAVGACELLRCSILLHDQRCHTAGEDVIPCAASACAPPLAVPGYSFLSMDVLCNPGQAEDGRVRARGRMMRDVHNMARILRETFVGILDRLQDACSSVEGFHPPVTPMILEVVRACSSVLQSHDQRWRLDTGPLVKSRAYGFLAGHYRSLEGLVAPGHQSLEALARNSHGAYQGPPCHMMQRLHSILTQFMALHTLRIFERDSALADGRRILQTLVDRTQAFLSDLAGIPDGFRPRPEGRDIIVVTRDEPAEFFYYQPPALVSATDPARSRVLQERCRITAPMYCVSIPPEGDGAVAARWDAFLGTAQATLGSSHAGRVGLLQLRLAVNMVWFAGQNRLPRGLFERTMDLFLTVQRLVPMGPAHLHGLGLSAEQAQALAMDECFFLLPVSQTIPVEVLTLDQPFRGYCIAGMPTAHAGGPFFSPTTPVSTEGAYRKSIALAGNAQNDGLLILCRVHEDMHARGDRKRSPSQRIYHKGERRRPRPTRPDTPQGGPPLPCPDTPQDAPSPLSYSNALTGSRPLSPNEDVWCLREQSHSFCSTPPTAGVWDPHEGDRVEGMWAGVEEEEICDPSTWLQCSRGASPPAAAPVPPERCRELFAEGILACHSGDQARLYDFLVLVLAFVRGIGRLDYGHALESLFQLSSQVLPGMEAFVPCDAGAPTACLYSEARICVAERLWPAMWSPPGVNASPDAPSRASFCDVRAPPEAGFVSPTPSH